MRGIVRYGLGAIGPYGHCCISRTDHRRIYIIHRSHRYFFGTNPIIIADRFRDGNAGKIVTQRNYTIGIHRSPDVAAWGNTRTHRIGPSGRVIGDRVEYITGATNILGLHQIGLINNTVSVVVHSVVTNLTAADVSNLVKVIGVITFCGSG